MESRYEKFVNDRLRVDLKRVLDQRDEIRGHIAEYLQLRTMIASILDMPPSQPVKTMIDLGANYYAHAIIPDSSRIVVFVGLDVYLEFTLDEATQFIDKRTDQLNAKDRALTDQASEISGRIKLVLEFLRELHFPSSAVAPDPAE